MARLDKIWAFHADILHTDYDKPTMVNAVLRIVLELETMTPVTQPLDEPWSVIAAATRACAFMGLFGPVYSLDQCIPKPHPVWERDFQTNWTQKISEFHPELEDALKTLFLRDLMQLSVQNFYLI